LQVTSIAFDSMPCSRLPSDLQSMQRAVLGSLNPRKHPIARR
jgi:hypothetical protein